MNPPPPPCWVTYSAKSNIFSITISAIIEITAIAVLFIAFFTIPGNSDMS
jgi:hypothetical protein